MAALLIRFFELLDQPINRAARGAKPNREQILLQALGVSIIEQRQQWLSGQLAQPEHRLRVFSNQRHAGDAIIRFKDDGNVNLTLSVANET